MGVLDIGSLMQADGSVALSLLEALWAAPIALALFDRDLRVSRVNPAMEELNGLSGSAHSGRTLVEVLPGLGAEAYQGLEQVLATGQPVVNVPYHGETAAIPGERRFWQGSCFPIRGAGGEIAGLCVLVVEISALKRQEEETRRARAEAERAARRLDQLHQLSTALSRALSAQRVGTVVLEVGMPLLGASSGAVLAGDAGAKPRPLATLGFGEAPLELLARADGQRPSPLVDAACSGNAVWLESRQASSLLYPSFAEVLARSEAEAAAVAPLVAEGKSIGSIVFAFREPRRFEPDDRAFILALAGQTAQAIERARHFEAEQQARARAQQDALLLDTFVAAAPCGLAFLDAQLRFVKVNAALAAVDGVSTEQHHGRALAEVVRIPELQRAVECVAETLQPLEALAMSTTDGSSGEARHWLASIYPVCDDQGALAGLGSAFLEVTAIRRAERERDESVRLLEEMLAAAPEGMALLDSELRLVRANPSLAALVGLPLSELPGRAVLDLLPPEQTGQLAALWRRTLEGGAPTVDYELRGRTSTRSWDCVAAWFPLRAHGRIVGLGLMVRDVAEQRRSRELQRDVLGLVGRDLRDPLTATAATAAHLLRDKALTPGARRGLERVLKSSRRIEQIIANLLDYTQVRAGNALPVSPRPVSLQEICDAALAQLEVGKGGAGVECHGEGEGSGEWDPERLEQLIATLLSHALEHGSGDGPVKLRWRGGVDEMVLEVESLGPPVPAQEREFVFEPFQSWEDERPTSSARGLGLFIASRIAAAHRGSLELCPGAAGGPAVFRLRLPRRYPGAERAGGVTAS